MEEKTHIMKFMQTHVYVSGDPRIASSGVKFGAVDPITNYLLSV